MAKGPLYRGGGEQENTGLTPTGRKGRSYSLGRKGIAVFVGQLLSARYKNHISQSRMTFLPNTWLNLPRIYMVLCSVCGVCARNASVARVGEDAELPCVFVPASMNGLIIEWTLQREEIRLAYSYHHGAARVLNQHPQFRDRAEVNETRLGHGEASLRLRNVSIRDEGTYGCYVRSVWGKHEETHQLLVAAPYSDPEVRCLSTWSWVTLSCVAGGGYPASELHWRWANGSQIPAGATGTRTPAAGGTYLLQATPLQLPAGTEGRVRCVVTNPLLNQTAQSEAVCQAGGGHPSTDHTRGCTRHCSPSAVHQEETRSRPGFIGSAVSLLLLLVMFVCVQYCRLQRCPA